jgi:hypothetical protein
MQITCNMCGKVVLESERVNVERARPLPPTLDEFKQALRKHIKATGHNTFHEGLGFSLVTAGE